MSHHEETWDELIVQRTHLGWGVFATRRIEAGTVLGAIPGNVIDDADYYSDYCMDLGETYSLEPVAPFRYINHNCLPNCELFSWCDEDSESVGPESLYVEVLRTIHPGEELSIDYAWPAADAIRCQCHSPDCRGWIVDQEEAHLIEKFHPECEVPSLVDSARLCTSEEVTADQNTPAV